MIFEFKDIIDPVLSDFLKSAQEFSKGFHIYLGGGFLRDKYCNVLRNENTQPRDIDLIFIPTIECPQLPLIPNTCIKYNMEKTDIKACRENIANIIGLHVKDLIPRDVQLIIYNQFMSAPDLTADMDCNVNQIMYSIENQRTYYTDCFEKGHANKEIIMLHDFSPSRMQKRLKRMGERFPDYKNEAYIQPQIVEEIVVQEEEEITIPAPSTASVKGAGWGPYTE